MALVVRADLPWLAGRRVRATSASPASSRLSATARQRKCPEVIQHGVPGGRTLPARGARCQQHLLPVAPDPAPHP
jgi:hypothetical protein